MGVKKTLAECLSDFKEVHGDKYSYALFDRYDGCKQAINIICNRCSDTFSQSVSNHKFGKGCPKCSGRRKITTQVFINECELLNPGKFSYDKCIYKNLRTKVTLFCHDCSGYRDILPSVIYKGYGCSCGTGKRISEAKTSNQDEFLRKCLKKRGDNFDYSKVAYSGGDKVSIGCNNCGRFFSIKPGNFLSGRGCPDCAKNKKLTEEEFHKRALVAHNGKYRYTDINHRDNEGNIKYICDKHGEITQSVWNHLKGHGCPICASGNAISNLKLSDIDEHCKQGAQKCHLYHIRMINVRTGKLFDKIGITTRSLEERYVSALNDGFEYIEIRIKKSTRYLCLVAEDKVKSYLMTNDLAYRVHDLRGTATRGWSECFLNTDEIQCKIDEAFDNLPTE